MRLMLFDQNPNQSDRHHFVADLRNQLAEKKSRGPATAQSLSVENGRQHDGSQTCIKVSPLLLADSVAKHNRAFFAFTNQASHWPWESLPLPLCSAHRQARANIFLQQADRRRCLAVGHLLEAALNAAGCNPQTTHERQGPAGQPELFDVSTGRLTNWKISIAHSAEYAGVIISPHPVGLDFETFSNWPGGPTWDVLENLMTEAERTILSSRTDMKSSLQELWVRKEALMKLSGCGFLQDANLFCTLQTGPDIHAINLTPFAAENLAIAAYYKSEPS